MDVTISRKYNIDGYYYIQSDSFGNIKQAPDWVAASYEIIQEELDDMYDDLKICPKRILKTNLIAENIFNPKENPSEFYNYLLNSTPKEVFIPKVGKTLVNPKEMTYLLTNGEYGTDNGVFVTIFGIDYPTASFFNSNWFYILSCKELVIDFLNKKKYDGIIGFDGTIPYIFLLNPMKSLEIVEILSAFK